ncbi:MAG: hypothetical protein HQ477_12695 [Chloroflexi bacterium]|nr:hypothetical protein [Chloroflexota bacterium]
MPTPAPAANSVSMPNIGANRLLIEQYIKTIYPSLVTAVDWATVIDDVDFEVLKSGQILSLIRMESSRMSGVCDALALISPPTEVEIFHADFSEALLSRYSDLNVGRDLAVAAGTEITQISSSLSNSSTAIKKLDRELEELAINSGLNYPPLLAGVTLKSAGLEVELVVPPGWQVSGVFHNVSLLAPPRLQGGGLRDVGLQFDASGSEFVYSRLRNPSGYGDQDIIDRVARLMNSYGELQSTAGFDFASRDGYVLELIEGSQNIRTTVWVVSIDGWSRIFRVSCPEDVHEFCVEDIIPMIDSAKFSG